MDWAVFGFWVRKVVAELVLLPAGPLIAVAIGLWIARRRRLVGLSIAALGLAVVVAFSLPIVANAIAAPAERALPPLAADLQLPPHTAIVVLGGGMQEGATDYGGETVNAATLARLRSAARLAARTGLPILVSGGSPLGERISEAELMAGALERDFHTPVRWVEKASLDTQANARLSAPLLLAEGYRTAILVTDVQHMDRARTLFTTAGMAVIPAPTDYYANGPVSVLSFIPNGNALRRSAWCFHEWAGALWLRLRR